MTKRILVLLGHPDGRPERFGNALATAYAEAATAAGHMVRRINLADVDTPFVEGQWEFESPPPPHIVAVQEDILWAEHIVLLFPLWLGATPARLKALLEQVFRAGFGFTVGPKGWSSKLKGRSARLVVTMGMPAFVFRLVFGSHGLLALDTGVLRLAGLSPVRKSVIGGVEAIGPKARLRWLAKMRRLGKLGG
ncbi:NAD(P)H dehydrogenase [Caulobacter sp. Root1455]|uniref:NAD(P)H-dependent oxidoreductase n=1 Tax=Caulobacter sp. Root1455 TaxID=1736465 RepID=UPI0006F5344C|nr:NAD(P)H-dependent oxidoreductase [Caulobacter sp. Root1455]KQZ06441.1 NAD(P)H dehydrogenase [Caulobacter sp. Root1455]